jgi:hypothetical protein
MFKKIARWWRKRRHPGMMEITLDQNDRIVMVPYRGEKLHVITDIPGVAAVDPDELYIIRESR